MSRGRHARPSRAAKAAGTTAIAGAAAAVAAAGFPGHASASVISAAHGTVVPESYATHTMLVTQHAVKRKPFYRVRPGDYLSRISSRLCGTAADWTGIYLSNKKTIGSNPDVIIPGMRLTLDCYEGRVWTPPVAVAAVQQGGPASLPHSQPQTVHRIVYQGGDPSGVLTRDQVGSLWLEAGGPAWAEYSAETIAYCESGWNTSAFNPSGATGLWQILGAVVPGNLYDGLVNAKNAVAKFEASGDTWAQWVCQV